MRGGLWTREEGHQRHHPCNVDWTLSFIMLNDSTWTDTSQPPRFEIQLEAGRAEGPAGGTSGTVRVRLNRTGISNPQAAVLPSGALSAANLRMGLARRTLSFFS